MKREVYIPWAKRAVKDALSGLEGSDLRAMLTEEELKKVDEVRRILTECRNMLYGQNPLEVGDFITFGRDD